MQRMEMALDEKRGAKMHQKHDTVCIANTEEEEEEGGGVAWRMTPDVRKDRGACCFFPAVYSP